jgi:hypothetical protein
VSIYLQGDFVQINGYLSVFLFIFISLSFTAIPLSNAEEPHKGLFMELISDTSLGRSFETLGVSLSGWVQGSYTASSSKNDQLPLGFNYLSNEPQLQQSWIKLERRADDKLPISFTTDWILPGTDYRFTLANGIFDEQRNEGTDRNPSKYGYDPVQFYIGLEKQSIMNIPVKIYLGKFASPYGVEFMEAVNTPFVSRSYTFIYNPFTHMGVLGEIEINDIISGKFGVASGSDAWIEESPKVTFLSGLEFTWTKSSLSIFSILSDSRFDQKSETDHPNIVDVVYSNSLGMNTDYQVQLLFGWQRNLPDNGTATWSGLVQYLSHKLSHTLAANGRFELFNDFDGNRTGFRGLYRTLSAGLTMSPEPWLQITPEVRGDYIGSSRPFNGKHYVLTAVLGATILW